MCRSKSPIGPHWWMLDLGTTVDVEAIKIVIAVSCHYNGQLIVYKWHVTITSCNGQLIVYKWHVTITSYNGQLIVYKWHVTITSHIHRKFKDLFMKVYNDLRG